MVNEPDLVDNILARLLQRVAEAMQRGGIVGLLTRDDDLACAFVAVGHLCDVANQIYKVALLCRGSGTAAFDGERNGVGAVLLEIVSCRITDLHSFRLLLTSSNGSCAVYRNEVLGR